jgi:hypothetical protein
MANLTLNRVYFWAVAICVSLPLTLGSMRADDSPDDLELARKTLEGFKDQDAKLRTAYRELGVQMQKAAVGDKKAKTAVAKKEAQFKKDQTRLLSRLDDEAIPAIRKLGDGGTKATADLIRFTELFVFDPKMEIPDLHVSVAFADQASWREAGKALGKIGIGALPELKKAFASHQVPVRFAAAMALGLIGPEVDRQDKNVYTDIAEYHAKIRGSTLERTEKDRRAQILQDALTQIRPPKK